MQLHGASFLPDPDTRVTGSFTIAWIEDGAAIAMRQSSGQGPPSAVWIIGRDMVGTEFEVLYADSRGVSRIYRMAFEMPAWQMWRETAEFSQRFEAVVSSDGQRITGAWTKSTDGGVTWDHDFKVDYLRTPPAEGVRHRGAASA